MNFEQIISCEYSIRDEFLGAFYIILYIIVILYFSSMFSIDEGYVSIACDQGLHNALILFDLFL